mgnify:CR=1 FL=1
METVDRVEPTPTPVSRPTPLRAIGRKAKAYVALTKPRVIELLLITTIPVMILAANGIRARVEEESIGLEEVFLALTGRALRDVE